MKKLLTILFVVVVWAAVLTTLNVVFEAAYPSILVESMHIVISALLTIGIWELLKKITLS